MLGFWSGQCCIAVCAHEVTRLTCFKSCFLQAILLFQVNRITRNLGAHAELESVLRTMQTELRTWQAQVQALTTGIAEALDRAG